MAIDGIRAEKAVEEERSLLERLPASSLGSRTQQGEGHAGGWMGRWKGKAPEAFKRNLPPWGMKISFVLKSKQANTCSAELNTNSQSYYLLFLLRQHSGTSFKTERVPYVQICSNMEQETALLAGDQTQQIRKNEGWEDKGNNNKGSVFAFASYVHIKRDLNAPWSSRF